MSERTSSDEQTAYRCTATSVIMVFAILAALSAYGCKEQMEDNRLTREANRAIFLKQEETKIKAIEAKVWLEPTEK